MTQKSPSSQSALVVVDLANDFVYAGGVIADAGGPEYQANARAIIPTLKKLIAAARRAGAVALEAVALQERQDALLEQRRSSLSGLLRDRQGAQEQGCEDTGGRVGGARPDRRPRTRSPE